MAWLDAFMDGMHFAGSNSFYGRFSFWVSILISIFWAGGYKYDIDMRDGERDDDPWSQLNAEN